MKVREVVPGASLMSNLLIGNIQVVNRNLEISKSLCKSSTPQSSRNMLRPR